MIHSPISRLTCCISQEGGCTSLYSAALAGSHECVRILIEAGANLDLQSAVSLILSMRHVSQQRHLLYFVLPFRQY